MDYREKIKSLEDLQSEVKGLQKDGKVVVQCHGCFDILHPGHIRYLEFAKKQGDVLVVSMTADKYILKGDDRPYMPEELRTNTMAALAFVDYVYLDDNSWAGPILEAVKPDIYVKGKEYESNFTGRFGEERNIVEAYGGTVFFSSGDVVFSSSQIIDDFKKRFSFDFEVFNIFCRRNNITLDGLHDLIHSFKGKKVMILGESILDEYHYSEVINVSGEAPILTIKPKRVDRYVGGAGIIAKHIQNLGGQSLLYSFLGEDEAANYISDNLEKDGVEYHPLRTSRVPTIRKVRFIGDDQKLLKVDYSDSFVFRPSEEKNLIDEMKQKLEEVDCLMFVDFGYGIVSDNLVKELTEQANELGKLVIGDVSGTMGGNISKYRNLYLTTPTEKEIRTVMDDYTSGLSVIANRFLKRTGNQNILVTLGANGLLIFKDKRFTVFGGQEEHLQNEYIPALEKKAKDPMGAGDALLAMTSLALSAGGSLEEAAYLGSVCSYIEVNKTGNVPVHIDEILDFLSKRMELAHA